MIPQPDSKLTSGNSSANAGAPSYFSMDVAKTKYSSKNFIEKFNYLENMEKERMNKILTNESYDNGNGDADGDADGSPLRIAGVEMGHKNRYKDVLPFENTRVRIPNTKSGCDYINASYLTSIDNYMEKPIAVASTSTKKHIKYIATQGPLNNTIGDFWRTVYEHKSPIIVSLTEERDGFIEKCANFWKTQTVHGNGLIKVTELESVVFDSTSTSAYTGSDHDEDYVRAANAGDSKSSIVLRRISVEVDNEAQHEVIQFHLKNWNDLGTFTNYDELLLVVFLKNFILRQMHLRFDKNVFKASNEEIPVVVHCSAGCGRTGTFCSIDSAIAYELNHYAADLANDAVSENSTPKLPEFKFPEAASVGGSSYGNDVATTAQPSELDPVYDNVEKFRKQRVSTVQTLRQYLLIYDTLLIFYKYKQTGKLGWFFNVGRGVPLIERFFESWQLLALQHDGN